jgi:single-stranded DNA-specific DHH superfamily exonuclease
MSGWEKEREAERREYARQLEESEKRRQADLQQLRQEFLSMLQASNGQSQVPQVLVKLFA